MSSASQPNLSTRITLKRKLLITEGIDDNENHDDEARQTTGWPRFLVIESKISERPVTSISPFALDKTLQGCVGTVKSVKKLRSGVLLVEVTRETQAANLLRLEKILDLEVTVSPHRSLNSCKGVVRSYELAQMEKNELLFELTSQNVTDINQIFVTRDGQKKKTNTMIVTFAQATIPPYLKAGYLNVPVQQYYPSPLRCFKCQQFGHHRMACRRAALCARCGVAEHEGNPCSGPLSCVNCKGDHGSFEKTCPKWLKEVEIMKIKINTNSSFPEARKMYDARSGQPTPGMSYSAVVRASQAVAKRTVATQTAIVRCRCQEEAPADDVEGEVQQVEMTEASVSVQTDAEAQATVRPVAAPRAGPSSPKLSTKAAAIVAENTARLAEKQAAASLSKQPVVARLGARAGNLPAKPANSANAAKPRAAAKAADKTWKDTGSDPERARKGSQDPLTSFNKYASLSQESMDSLDPIDYPVGAAGAPSGRGRRNVSSKKPT
jgi:hypothetical protein